MRAGSLTGGVVSGVGRAGSGGKAAAAMVTGRGIGVLVDVGGGTGFDGSGGRPNVRDGVSLAPSAWGTGTCKTGGLGMGPFRFDAAGTVGVSDVAGCDVK